MTAFLDRAIGGTSGATWCPVLSPDAGVRGGARRAGVSSGYRDWRRRDNGAMTVPARAVRARSLSRRNSLHHTGGAWGCQSCARRDTPGRFVRSARSGRVAPSRQHCWTYLCTALARSPRGSIDSLSWRNSGAILRSRHRCASLSAAARSAPAREAPRADRRDNAGRFRWLGRITGALIARW